MKERDNIFEINLLKSLFVSSTVNGKLLLPTEKEYLLEELVLGTLDYLDRPNITRRREFNILKATSVFHRNLDNRIEWLKNSLYLDEDISTTIYELMHSYKENCSPDSFTTPFYNICRNELEGTIIHSTNGKISTTSPEIINYTRNIIIPTFSEEQQRDILGIGNCMKKYIIEDLEYLSCKL